MWKSPAFFDRVFLFYYCETSLTIGAAAMTALIVVALGMP
jgi:hypothetical protein